MTSFPFPARAAAATALAAVLTALALPAPAAAQAGRNAVVLGLTLEPPGLDPTTAPAAAIGEIVHYNVLEGLTRIGPDGRVAPLLAERWRVEPDGKTWVFTLREGVRFHDGEAFDSADVRFSFERARAEGSTNKAKKTFFDNILSVATPDARTVVLTLKNPDGNLLFRLGENTTVILDPKSAATTATRPVGTGPYRFDAWRKGSSVTLVKWPGYRDAAAVKLERATFRFISDPAAQAAALLAGDVDAFPRFQSPQSFKQFEGDARYTATVGGTEGKTLVAINHRRKPFDDVRVRRALAAAIDRREVIDGSQEGYGAPIGSHLVPSDQGYVDLTGVNRHDPELAKALLKEAGVATPLDVTLVLPPPPYARLGGEIVAAQLAQVGIRAKIENVEWAQWLSGAFKGQFDLTLISHVEPLDFGNYADPAYYWGYDSPGFRDLYARYNAAQAPEQRLQLLGQIQARLAEDAVNVFLYQLPQFTVAKKGLQGLWRDSPVYANDLASMHW